jgi:hypothetical protein
MPGIDGLETSTQELLCQVHVGVCVYVPSCQTLNGVASQELGDHGSCQVLESPWVTRRARNDQSGGKILSARDCGGRPGMIRS